MSLPDSPRDTPFLTRVSIRNYKSIAQADVKLGAFTILVGRNGSGKSNFLDALRLIAEGLQDSLSLSLAKRQGIAEIKWRGAGDSEAISFRLEITFPDRRLAIFILEISGEPWAASVHRERLTIHDASGSALAHFEVKDGKVVGSSMENMPPVFSDRFYLVNAAGLVEFRPVYDFLANMGFYNIAPDAIRKPQIPDISGLLRGDGSNLASAVTRLRVENPEAMERVKSYLEAIVPGIEGVETVAIPPYETLKFVQHVVSVSGNPIPYTFQAAGMSDGTLRVLATLVAVAQLSTAKTPASLVGIEEPESALHPAAAGALMDALREAASQTQVLITSHSADLLDQVDLEADSLLAVLSENGVTKIAPMDKASFSVLQEHLYTPGELLRLDQFEPDREDLARQKEQSSVLENWDKQA